MAKIKLIEDGKEKKMVKKNKKSIEKVMNGTIKINEGDDDEKEKKERIKNVMEKNI